VDACSRPGETPALPRGCAVRSQREAQGRAAMKEKPYRAPRHGTQHQNNAITKATIPGAGQRSRRPFPPVSGARVG